MNLPSIWSALEEINEILGDSYAYPAMDKTASALSLSPDYFTWVAAVVLFGAEPFTVGQFMQMLPYGLARVNEDRFRAAVRQGYLSEEDEKLRASASGLGAARQIFAAMDRSIASLRPLPAQPLQALVHLLYRLAGASFAMPEPPVHFLLDHKRAQREIGATELIQQFERYASELQGYRDDCYIATWGAHGVEGHTWDMLDLLSQGAALPLADLHAKLSRRGVTEEAHAGDVRELVVREWAELRAGMCHITSAGRQARAEVEAKTERLFFQPWSCLSAPELAELLALATQLRDSLRR